MSDGILVSIMSKKTKLKLVAAVAMLVVAYTSIHCQVAFLHTYYISVIITGSLAALAFCVALVAWDMSRMDPSNSHTLRSLMLQYMFVRFLGFYARHTFKKFTQLTKNCREVQDKLLAKVLRENKDTKYGQKHGLCDIKTREDYIKHQPLTTYEDYKEYMEDIANGKQNVLTADRVVFLPSSSGTSTESRVLPYCSKYRTLAWFALGPMLYRSLKQFKFSLRRYICIRLHSPPKYSPGGIQIAGAAAYMNAPLPYNLTPACYMRIYKEVPSLYVQALFALSEKKLEVIEGAHSNMCHTFFRVIERHWEQLCTDIELGRVNPTLDIPEDVRKELDSYLKPSKKRADQLRVDFDAGIKGIAKRVWPHIKHFVMINTGAFAHCANLLEQSSLKGVPVVSAAHMAPEGTVGYNFEEDLTVSRYHFIPQVTFFEFIPVEDHYEEQPRTVFLDQVEKGKEYEVVMTTTNGLFRYRLGDVIKVVDFFNTCPIYEFRYRFGQVLNLMMENTPDTVMYEAVMKCEQQWPGVTIENYVVTENFILEKVQEYSNEGRRKHYVLFIEVFKENEDLLLTKGQKSQIDKNLCEHYEAYNVSRKQKELFDPIRVIQVKSGTFEELKSRMTNGLPNMQFKMPRVLRRVELLSFLLERKKQV